MAHMAPRPMFGKKQPVSYEELKKLDWNAPDRDGVVRTLSLELWDDPETGNFLTRMGYMPNDPRNIRKTMDDYRADFDRAKALLDLRVREFNAEHQERYGHCQVVPFLLIDGPVWDGKHGAFLFAQLELCPYDAWNVMLLAKDEETVKRCPVLPHVGPERNLNAAMEKKIATSHARYEHGLELFGLTATGQDGGISREMWEEIEREIRDDLLAFVANARRVFTEALERFAADLRSGKIRINS